MQDALWWHGQPQFQLKQPWKKSLTSWAWCHWCASIFHKYSLWHNCAKAFAPWDCLRNIRMGKFTHRLISDVSSLNMNVTLAGGYASHCSPAHGRIGGRLEPSDIDIFYDGNLNELLVAYESRSQAPFDLGITTVTDVNMSVYGNRFSRGDWMTIYLRTTAHHLGTLSAWFRLQDAHIHVGRRSAREVYHNGPLCGIGQSVLVSRQGRAPKINIIRHPFHR